MPTIDISEETLSKFKEQFQDEIEEVNIEELDDLIGKKFFFRAVTYHIVGKVEKRVGDFVELSGASWLADQPRLMNLIKNGELGEVEPVGKMFVNLKAVTDFIPWNHKLPTKQQ